jgi:hypothetical protein
MYADDTSILNTTSNNIGVIEQYFETNNLYINPSKTHWILFQTKQCRQESNLTITIKKQGNIKCKKHKFPGGSNR